VTRFTWANAVSSVRLLAIAPCAYAIAHDEWAIAAALFVVAVVTDLSDGVIARRRGEVSTFGGLLDHGSDALFVTVALATLAAKGAVPFPLPPLVIAAFAQYVWDSDALAGAPLRASRVGRWNGIGYYALVGTAVLDPALTLNWVPSFVLRDAGWLLVASTLLSMADRGYGLWRLRRG
jgi:phosphatidylglycerophosphate synthase